MPNSVTSYDDEFSNKLRNVREGASKSRAIVNEKTIILKSLGWVDGLVKSGLEAGSIAAEVSKPSNVHSRLTRVSSLTQSRKR